MSSSKNIVIYKDPIEMLKDKINNGSIVNINPYNTLAHIFLVDSNGYKYVEVDGVSYIQQKVEVLSEDRKAISIETELDLEKTIELEYQKQFSLYNQCVLKIKEFTSIITKNINHPKKSNIENDISVLEMFENKFKEIEQSRNKINGEYVFDIKDVTELENINPFFNSQIMKQFREGFKGLVFKKAMIFNAPNNLSHEWKETLSVFEKVMERNFHEWEEHKKTLGL